MPSHDLSHEAYSARSARVIELKLITVNIMSSPIARKLRSTGVKIPGKDKHPFSPF